MDAHEAAQMHQTFSQQLLQDHIAACSLPEHNLISVRKKLCLTFFQAYKSTLSTHFYVYTCAVCSRYGTIITMYFPPALQWTDGPPPVQIQAQNGPTTSLAGLL